jgi:hypothetical protein
MVKMDAYRPNPPRLRIKQPPEDGLFGLEDMRLLFAPFVPFCGKKCMSFIYAVEAVLRTAPSENHVSVFDSRKKQLTTD